MFEEHRRASAHHAVIRTGCFAPGWSANQPNVSAFSQEQHRCCISSRLASISDRYQLATMPTVDLVNQAMRTYQSHLTQKPATRSQTITSCSISVCYSSTTARGRSCTFILAPCTGSIGRRTTIHSASAAVLVWVFCPLLCRCGVLLSHGHAACCCSATRLA